jgi:hypothetical protein
MLLLGAMVFGALLSYLMVMVRYYNMPENTTMLVVKDVVFPVHNASYFNVTILNPSNSISDVNVTAILLRVKGENAMYEINNTDPLLPFELKIGAEQIFKCKSNWSMFAGKTVEVEPIAEKTLTTKYTLLVPSIRLKISTNFESQVQESIEYFNVTIENLQPTPLINLTITDIHLQLYSSIFRLNSSPPLPFVLEPNQAETFRCEFSWEGLLGLNATIIVKTAEGYESAYEAINLPGASPYIADVNFNYDDVSRFNLTIINSERSTSTVHITKINLTLSSGEEETIKTTWPLNVSPLPVPPNKSATLVCLWNWSSHREELVTVKVYTKQGFVMYRNFRTPSCVALKVSNETSVFNLKDKDHFNLTIQNHWSSLEAVNVTKIVVKQANDTLDGSKVNPQLPYGPISPGKNVTFICNYNWKIFFENYGRNLTLTIYVTSILSQKVYLFDFHFNLPAAELKVTAVNCSMIDGSRYLNLTVRNAEYSIWNLTLTKAVIVVQGLADSLEYVIPRNQVIVNVGEEIIVLCPFDWQKYQGKKITITVFTAELIEASTSYTIP